MSPQHRSLPDTQHSTVDRKKDNNDLYVLNMHVEQATEVAMIDLHTESTCNASPLSLLAVYTLYDSREKIKLGPRPRDSQIEHTYTQYLYTQ